jgi:hypothetical protein
VLQPQQQLRPREAWSLHRNVLEVLLVCSLLHGIVAGCAYAFEFAVLQAPACAAVLLHLLQGWGVERHDDFLIVAASLLLLLLCELQSKTGSSQQLVLVQGKAAVLPDVHQHSFALTNCCSRTN